MDILQFINFLFINTFHLLITVPYYKQYFDKQPRTCIFVYLSNNLRINSKLWNYMIKRVHICGTWVAQSVGWLTLDFPSDHNLRSWDPALFGAPGSKGVSLGFSLSFCPPLPSACTHAHPHPLSLPLFL